MRIRIFALLSLAFLLTQANASTRVPMSIANNEYCSYFYGDYETSTPEPSRTDWWGTAEYSLTDEADDIDGTAAGTFIALDDADDLSWEYYSNTDIPVHSNGAVNIVVKYYGCGMNMVDNVEVTDLGISPVVANDGGNNVKAIFYRKTIEKENATDTYYTYTTIPNPFSRRPVRPSNITAQTGANCKYLGFYGWAAEYSDCSLTYADGGNFISEGGFDNVVWPDRKLRVTVTGDNPTITFKALWKQAVVNINGIVSGFTNTQNINDPTHYERQFTIFKTTGLSIVSQNNIGNYPMTVSMLYPDGTDAGCYVSGGTYTGLTCSEIYNYKVEYFNFTNSSTGYIQKNAASDNANYFRRLVVGRGVKMLGGGVFNFIGLKTANNSGTNIPYAYASLGLGVNLRVESGTFSSFDAFYNSTEDVSTTGASNNYPNVNVNNAGAENSIVFGCDFDRWRVSQGVNAANEELKVTGNTNLFRYVRFASNTTNFDVVIKSGTLGTSSDDIVNFGIDYKNEVPKKRASGAANVWLNAGRNIAMLGGVINACVYGGHDENIIYTVYYTTGSPIISIGSDGYSILNGNNGTDVLATIQDVSSIYYNFKMNGGIVNGDFYGGDNVKFADAGSTRLEITAQPRHLVFTGGTMNGNIYGGSKYDNVSNSSYATTLTNDRHLSALANSDVSLYIGGNVTFGGSTEVFGGDNNTANTSVKTLHSVRNVKMIVSDGKSISTIYGGGNGAGLGKSYNWESINPKGGVDIRLLNANVTNVYGGMKGDSHTDMITGSSAITINGGTYINVYGGGNGAGTEIKGSTTVTLNSGNVTNVYGGGNQGNVGQFTSDIAAVNINGGTVSGCVYGGGFQGYSHSSPVVNIKGGSIGGNVYGGANGGASYQDVVYTKGVRTVNVADNANVTGNVYGGSLNCNDQVVGTESGITGNFAVYGQTPVWPSYSKFVQQFIILSDEMGGPKNISSIVFEPLYNKTSTTFTRTVTVYMQHTNSDRYDYQGDNTTSNASQLINVSADTKRASGAIITVDASTTMVEIPFDSGCDFAYDGTSNVVVTVIGNSGNEASAMTYSGTASISGITGNKLVWKTIHTDYCRYMYMNGGNNCASTTYFDTHVFNNTNVGNAGSATFGRSCVPVVGFTYSISAETTKHNATAFVNTTKGNIGGSIYGSGNNNKMYGGCYVNIGADAVANAPGHEANVNAIENPATGAITIGGSVYAGSNSTGAWSYANADRLVSGVSEVYLDGNGYDGAITIGSSKAATAGNIFGCSINGEGGKLGSSVYISNIGSRNKEGKYLSATTWEFGSVQHTDTLVLNNAHVTFNGAKQIEDDTKTNSVYGVHKVMSVVNNSTALLKADADSIAKVGSYECTDVYADSPVYTEVTAVSGAENKIQLTDCKNTVVFDGGGLYIRNMVSGTETYGELNGYLYAVNTDSEHTANARARQKKTDHSDITNGTDNSTDGGFVSYDATFNTYDNPPGDNYPDGEQEIAFTNVTGETYRIWGIQASPLPNLWTEYVTSRPPTFPDDETITAGGADYIIPLTCEDDLAWFISYVNGFNGSSAHPSAKAKLTADVDMSSLVWVPIGINSSKPFSGVFDGNYHTIDGIHIADATEVGYVEGSEVGTNGDMTHTGMFGYAYGATIRNTFVMSGRLANTQNEGYIGGLVARAINTNIEMCETADTLTASSKFVGGIVGNIDTNNANSSLVASMSTATIIDNYSGYSGSLGGIAARSSNSDLLTVSDCFSNVTISGNTVSYQGTICGWAWPKNCYMHKNTSAGTIANLIYNMDVSYNLYAPNSFTGTATGKFTNAAAYQYGDYATNNVVTVGEETKPLVDKLNDNANANYQWIRPKGSLVINGGYPFVARKTNDTIMAVVGISNDKRLYYGEANEMITKYGSNPNADIYVYSNGTLTTSPTAARLFIDENVAIMQDISSKATDDIVAYVGITFDNSKGTAEMARDWHMFSASISGGKTGINYGAHQSTYTQFSTALMTFGTEGNWDYNLKQGDEAVYFPDGITTEISDPGKQFDIYSFFEPQYHWINLKRASGNHWHEDEPHNNIVYNNEETYTPGKGYMIALGDNATKNNNLMQAKGTLNKGHITVPVTATGEHLTGYNLIGNPYQSYLDFNKFANANEDIWTEGETGYKAYLIYNADKDGFVEYLVDNAGVTFSHGAAQEGDRYINMHQGFFVVKNGEATDAVFEDTMRVTNQTPHFRDEVAPTYPLVNLFCTDEDGKQEINVMEFERPLKAGSLKMKGMLNGKCNMYIHWNGDDLGSVFIDYMPDYVPVWFEAAEDGVFTITWSTANANFGYMHLIDNITGTDYDCLAPGHDHYTFSASTTDMRARFRVVFKPFGIEEEMSEQGEDFAFISGEELVVNGIGELSFIDLNGRVLATEFVSGQQCHIALPNVAEGMYLLRLAGTNGVKVQKIVIRR